MRDPLMELVRDLLGRQVEAPPARPAIVVDLRVVHAAAQRGAELAARHPAWTPAQVAEEAVRETLGSPAAEGGARNRGEVIPARSARDFSADRPSPPAPPAARRAAPTGRSRPGGPGRQGRSPRKGHRG